MIETGALIIFLSVLGVPLLIGLIYSFLTRPSKYYYKHDGYKWTKKRF
jgi:hypothetical protein